MERLATEEGVRQLKRWANSFGAVADQFLAVRDNQLRRSTAAEYRRFFKGADLTALAGKPLDAITRADVTAVLDKIDARGRPSASNHALAYLRRFFNWCVDRDLIERAPTERIKLRHPEVSRDRFLSASELALVLRALDDDASLKAIDGVNDLPSLSERMRDFVRLLLLTGQRRAEVAGMTWDEIRDLDGAEPRWELPAARTKNKRDHLVPLSSAAVEVLRRRRNERSPKGSVFGQTGDTALSLATLRRAKTALDGRIAAIAAAQGVPTPAPWTWHDLRRTMVTMMNEELGIAPHIVEAVVNHVSGAAKAGVAGVYNRALYLAERRSALEAWAVYVERLGAP